MNSVAVIANRHRPQAEETLQRVCEWGQSHGIEVLSSMQEEGAEPIRVPELDDPMSQELRQKFGGCDIALTLGGDGTLIYGAHLVAPLGIPLLPVNLGSLGFHTQTEPGEMIDCLEAIRRGDFRTEPRQLLQAQLERPEPEGDSERPGKAIALNDIVVSRSAWGRMVHLRLHVNGQPATDLHADGLVVSTPTGSSAYNYAARGPIVEPSVEAFVVNAVCPHRMNFSPLVLSANSVVVVEFHPRKPLEEAQLLVDGHPWFSVTHDERLKISRAPMYLPLVVFESNFYQKLRDKLAWGGLS